MARCTLTLRLDRSDRRYAPGDLVAGVVRVGTAEECRTDGLVVGCQWRTSGYGNPRAGQPVELTLFSGTWTPGHHELAFSLTLPPGPVTYQGRDLHVNWHVRARARVSASRDPEVEEEIEMLAAGPVPGYRSGSDEVRRLIESLSTPTRNAARAHPTFLAWLLGGLLALFLLPGAGALIVGASVLAGALDPLGTTTAPELMLVGGGFVAVSSILFLVFGWPILARRRLGPVVFEVGPRALRPGASVSCRIDFVPRARVALSGIEASLTCVEESVLGSGRGARARRHQLARQDTTLSLPRDVLPGEPVSLSATFQVPADAPPSFFAASNCVGWTIAARIRVRGWPDWRDEAFLEVAP